ncbi:MAG: PilN domain-containing protein [Verrucomicrobia bacterium]|nr:PilN domain-containing protein [Verrucomicrobiota bacterium]
MSGFNLLPEQFRRRRGGPFVALSVAMTAGIAVLCLLLMELGVVSSAARGSGSVLRETLADRRRDVAVARASRRAVEAEIKAMAAMLPRTPVWTNLLIDTARVVGSNMQIERWSADTDRGVCALRGRAASNGEVFELVGALEALPYFSSVTLAGVSRKDSSEQGDRDVVFEIVCRFHQVAR